MSKSSKSNRAQKTHRKIQVSSAHNRKTVSRPNYKKTTNKGQKSQAKKMVNKKTTKAKKSTVKSPAVKRTTQKTKTSQSKNVQKKSTKIKVNTSPVVKIEPAKEPVAKIAKRPLGEITPVVDVVQSDKIQHFAQFSDAAMLAEMDQAAKTSSETMALEQALDGFDMGRVNERMAERKQMDIAKPHKVEKAQEIKEAAIKKAIQSMAREEIDSKQPCRRSRKMNFGLKRLALALACATAMILAVAYFVNLNAPDVSIKVAAMQSGIDAKYPSYTPRDFSLSDISSENGRIALNFKNATSGDTFSLVEESSAWDSTALLNNYVKNYYGEDFSVVKEQGLTLYMTNKSTCWVNGGIVYKLNVTSGSLTKKQIKAIATSL